MPQKIQYWRGRNTESHWLRENSLNEAKFAVNLKATIREKLA
jgi:hypothetical protein